MPTLEQENTVRDELKKGLEELFKIDHTSLARESELGTKFSFTEGLPFFNRIVDLYREFESIPLEGISFKSLNAVLTGVREALALFKSVVDFNPLTVPNPNDIRKQIIDRARDQYEAHYDRVTPVLAFATRKGPDFAVLESKALDSVAKMDKLSADLSQKGTEYTSEAASTLEKLQEAAGKVGVARHAVNFEEQSEEHLGAAKWWFWATLVSVALGVAAVWALFIGPFMIEVKGLELGEAIYHVASRIMAFSVVSFAIYWAAKNHGAHRHNYIINKHRQNALATFQAFTEAAKLDADVKAAVLLQASQAIYTAQSTGYSETMSAPPNPINMVEIIKCATAKH